ncbi:MAG: hypothetical protein MUC34_08785 [Anaerolineae bacterium]|nr:hypothetical protein [Anaerolineae bacterium]
MFGSDFLDMIRALNANDVRYLIVGGYAVAFHGHPRYTKALDIWVEASVDNARRVVKAVDDFGFGSLGLTAEDFSVEGQVVQLGNPPSRIDFITSADGVVFSECYAARVESIVDDTPVKFIDLKHLRQNKAASGREADLADLKELGAPEKRDGEGKTNR